MGLLMSAIIPKTNGDLSTDIGETTAVSWKPPNNLTFEKWERVGNTLQVLNRAVGWWIGDWLACGEQRYGETYSQALTVTDSSIETLKKYKSVSERVPFSIRTEELSWTHHSYVAYMPEEQRGPLLEIAAAYNLASRELKEIVSKSDSDRQKLIELHEGGYLKTYSTFDDLMGVMEPEPQYELSEAEEQVLESAGWNETDDPDLVDLPFTDEPEILEDDEEVQQAFINFFADAGITIVDAEENFIEFDNGLTISADLNGEGEAVLLWGIP